MRIPRLTFSSVRGYRKECVLPDLLAGITLLVIAVPEQLATSRLAGMPPVTGFYAFIAGTAMFAFLGSNPQMSVGADSTIAPLFAVGIAHIAPAGSASYLDLVGVVAVMAGVIVALVGLLRLGWIAEFLSAPIVTGFLAGVAVIILVHQLPDFFGIHPVTGSTWQRIDLIAGHLGGTNGWALGIGVVSLGILFLSERIDRRLPGALVALAASTIVVGALNLHARGVQILGSFAHGAPRWGLVGLSWSTLGSAAPIATVVALVVITQTAATTRAFAEQGGYDVDVGRDFLGVGAGSVAAGLVGSFPVNASPARTAAVAASSGRTQAAGLGAAAALVLLIPAAGILKDVPSATLAAVLIFIATRIFRLRELLKIARFDILELGLALVTLLTVALVGIEQGIGVAVGLAILDRTRRTARPTLHVLGRIPGTTSWVPLSVAPEASQVPGVLVVLFATPLWYANAIHFRTELRSAVSRAPAGLEVVVLDAAGMSDVDYTGSTALGEVLDELEHEGISLAVSRAGERVRTNLRRSGLLYRIGENRFFPSTDSAVTSVTSRPDAKPPEAKPPGSLSSL